MDDDAEWVHYVKNLQQILKIRFSERAHLLSLSLKRSRNNSISGLFMNIYESCILVLDEEQCKMEVLKRNKR